MKNTNYEVIGWEKEQNPIYQRLRYLLNHKKKNVTILFYGDVGNGKSETAIKFACDLDPTFDVSRIVFSIKGLLAKSIELGNKSKGKVIILDELANEEGADSRNSLSEINKQISYVTTVARAKGFVLFYIAPLISQMDKRIRLIGTTAYVRMIGVNFDEGYAEADFQWTYIGKSGDLILNPHPRIRLKETEEFKEVNYIRIAKCKNTVLLDEYAIVKNTFIDGVLRNALDKIEAKDKKEAEIEKKSWDKMIEQVKECSGEVMRLGRYSGSLIAKELNISLTKGTALAGMLNKPTQNEQK